MKLSNIKVEQIDINGKITEDFSEILLPSELIKILINSFDNLSEQDGVLFGEFSKQKYAIYFKNISYLGHPHPLFKKRIQIPSSFRNIYKLNKENNIETLLIGVYKYHNNILFCNFDTTRYINNSLNNSSAHVYSIDLKKGVENGIFQKTDMKRNIITVFRPDKVHDFLKTRLIDNQEISLEIADTFDDFFQSVSKLWYGIDCYQEMIEANFPNKFQPEWPGFYLEFKLQEYIHINHKTDVIIYSQNKKKGSIDLDLYFPKLNSYGDLKAHSGSSPGIQGNDYETIMSLLEHQSIYYIICNHETIKDKDRGYVVTEYWNRIQDKKYLRSYGNKMKNQVVIKSYYILEINKDNKKYLDIFYQGVNSNGKPRNPKISISSKNINNFLIHAFILD